jgi:hypothetical protein
METRAVEFPLLLLLHPALKMSINIMAIYLILFNMTILTFQYFLRKLADENE